MTSGGEQIVVIGGGVIGLCCAPCSCASVGTTLPCWTRASPRRTSEASAAWVTPALSELLAGPGAVASSLRAMLNPGAPIHISPWSGSSLARRLAAFWRSCNAKACLAGRASLGQLSARSLRRWAA